MKNSFCRTVFLSYTLQYLRTWGWSWCWSGCWSWCWSWCWCGWWGSRSNLFLTDFLNFFFCECNSFAIIIRGTIRSKSCKATTDIIKNMIKWLIKGGSQWSDLRSEICAYRYSPRFSDLQYFFQINIFMYISTRVLRQHHLQLYGKKSSFKT